MTFLNEGTFVRTAPVQEMGVLLKWNNSKSLEKGLSYVWNLLFLTTKFYFQNQSPKCRVDGYKFRSVYIQIGSMSVNQIMKMCIAEVNA